MKVFADKVNNRLSVCFEKADDQGAFIEQNILHLFSFEPNEDYCFVLEKTSEAVKIDYSFEKERLLCADASALKTEEVFKLLSEFITFIYGAQTENKLTCYDAVLFDGESFKLLDSLVPENRTKFEIIKDFISGLSEDSSNFGTVLRTELIEACEKEQGEEELLTVIDRYEHPDDYMIKICPGCGVEYEIEANYCLKCGLKLEIETLEKPKSRNVNDNSKTEVLVREDSPSEEIESLAEPDTEAQTGSEEELSSQVNEQEYSADDEDKEADELSAEPEPEEQTYSEPAQEPSFGETTLLGFTNFGETSVLGGMATDFATPNLVRTSTGEKVFITKRNFIIGKNASMADFVINNNTVSRVHAEITAIGNEYYVKDKNSTNHTYVNNQILSPEEAKQIFEGDEIKLADESLVFHLY